MAVERMNNGNKIIICQIILVVIMYELLLREKLTQKQLVNLSDCMKQVIWI